MQLPQAVWGHVGSIAQFFIEAGCWCKVEDVARGIHTFGVIYEDLAVREVCFVDTLSSRGMSTSESDRNAL